MAQSNSSNILGGDNNCSQRPAGGVEDITNRLDRMNVDMAVDVDMEMQPQQTQQQQQVSSQATRHQVTTTITTDAFTLSQQQQQTNYLTPENSFDDHENYYDWPMEPVPGMQGQLQPQQQQQQQQLQPTNTSSNILIVTNVDSSVFNDKSVQANFEALFLAYDPSVTFRYLKSFRRVRLDFTDDQSAEMARSNLGQYRLGNTEFRCYTAQIIRPNNNSGSNNNPGDPTTNSNTHLNIPKLTKQFLISPPASPPVGWEPVNESSPCIDVQLISAIANLVPGKVHEIHPGNESQPGIYVEVCEDPQFESASMRTCSRTIPRTMSPQAAFSQ